MKYSVVIRALSIFILLIAIPLAMKAGNKDKKDISSLWKEYHKEIEKDKPASAIKILDEIRSQALSQRKAWDYYDACVNARELGGRINWRKQDSLRSDLEAKIRLYDDPMMTSFAMMEYRSGMRANPSVVVEFIKSNAKRLRSGNTPDFMRNATLSNVMGPVIRKGDFFRNDYENALALVALNGYDAAAKMLLEEFSGRYPQAAWVEYEMLRRKNLNSGKSDESLIQASLEVFIKKYAGKAISALAVSDSFWSRYRELDARGVASSDDYKRLADDIKAFQSSVKTYSGLEKEIGECGRGEAGRLLEILEGKSAQFSVKDGIVTVQLRNLKSADLNMTDDNTGKSVWKHEVKNGVNSFYVMDTVRVALPAISDGDYAIRLEADGKNIRDELDYNPRSISVATRIVDGRFQIYAADYNTGKPFPAVSGIALDGFTDLPQEVVARLKSGRNEYFECTAEGPEGSVLKSEKLYQSSFYESVRRTPSVRGNSVVLTSSGAYRPGDKLEYKVIAYKEHQQKDSYSEVYEAGTKLLVRLFDAMNKEAGMEELTTNEFGSASGSFVLPSGRRNGNWRIEVSPADNSFRTYAYVYVGEYVLPTYEIVIDRNEDVILTGEPVRFTGHVNTYSGRRLKAGMARYELHGPMGGETRREGSLDIAPDGSFNLFVNDAEGSISFTVSITDETGETESASSFVNVVQKPSMYIRVINENMGYFREKDAPKVNWSGYIIDSDILRLDFHSYSGNSSDAVVAYSVTSVGGKVVASGTSGFGECTIQLPATASDLYHVDATVTIRGRESGRYSASILKLKPDAKTVNPMVEYFFCKFADNTGAMFGSGNKDIWAVGSVASFEGSVLQDGKYHVKAGSTERILFDKAMPDDVSMSILWFWESTSVSWESSFSKPAERKPFPLEFTSFTDKTGPSQLTTISIRTSPDAECALTVYDKSTESLRKNSWNDVLPLPFFGPTYLRMNLLNGSRDAAAMQMYKMAVSRASVAGANVMMDVAEVVEEEAIPFMAGDTQAFDGVKVRSELLDILAFEPALRPDSDGRLSVSFTPSGKLSTYIVKVYSHDKQMNTAVIDREMTVYQPLQVSMATPSFLYRGDRYVLHASVSADDDCKIAEGTMRLTVYDGKNDSGKVVLDQRTDLQLRDGVASCSFELPSVPDCDNLAFRLMFVSYDTDGHMVSDGVMVSSPVFPASRKMTESHSGLLLSGMDRNTLISNLRREFTNLDPSEAVVSERNIAEMMREVLEKEGGKAGSDAVSLARSIVAKRLSAKMTGTAADTSELESKLLALRGSDGGFSWMDGMDASEYVSAYVLYATAALRDRDCLPESLSDLSSTVSYLDRCMAGKRGWNGIGVEAYCHVRSMYPEVEFSTKLASATAKAIRKYLGHSDAKAMNGQIMYKTRRALTIDNLNSSKDGIALAKAWGMKFATSFRLSRSRGKDVASLKEYAVKHPMGGMFFPNAVMPFRGMLESELHAHVLLIDLFQKEDAALADAIRLWVMLQKETQEWKNDPSTVLAISAVMDGSEELMQTRVVSLTVEAEQAFADTREAGNAMKVKTSYFVREKGEWVPVSDGYRLHVGQEVKAEYSLYSEQNRSFVMLDAPRPACLVPVDQISGYAWFNIYGLYRDVKTASTQYWWDTFPEDKSTVSEYFTVSQEGVFQSPASEIVCLYAPHWRANDAARALSSSEFDNN